MTISFRTRLFVISGLIVTAVITVVMLVGWTRVLAFEAERLEQRLCMEAKRIATQPMRGEDMVRLAADILIKLNLTSPDQLLMQFEVRTEGQNFMLVKGQPESALDGAVWRTATGLGSAGELSHQSWQSTLRAEEGMPSLLGNKPQQPNEPPYDKGRPRWDRPNQMGACSIASFKAKDKAWRAARFTVDAGRSIVAADLVATRADVHSALKQALEMVIPLALALTALGAWLLSALTMRPVNRLRNAMQVVTQKALDQRMPSDGEDREFKVLIGAYNTMLSRLEASFQQASRFSADAAHELKTPLTILQGRIEQALAKSEQPALQNELIDLLDEVGRLSSITRKLLLLSQADSGLLLLQRKPVDLSTMLDEITADAHMLETSQDVQSHIAPQLVVQGDAVLLVQLFNNLLSNAVRYGSPRGWINLTALSMPSGVEVVFSNNTSEISKQDRARFFERFYRCDAAHNRRIDGNGLGLSLAREIARAHGGDLALVDSASDVVVLKLTLPLSKIK